MVYLERKKIKGKYYLYLVISTKINGKTKRVWQKYLGSEEKFKDKAKQMKIKLDNNYDLKTKEFGMEYTLFKIAQKLNFEQTIDDNVSKRDQGLSVGKYMLIATLNRCTAPTSKKSIKSWFDRSILKDLLPPIDTYLNSNAYLNHFRYLTPEIIDKIQMQLNLRIIHEFAVKMEYLFYDPTNFYTYINPKHENQSLARHGNSKEGRYVLNLISLSVVCTQDGGLPILHQTYPGNEQDAAHFKKQHIRILDHINKYGLNPSEITLIFDKGNISEKPIQKLFEENIKFVCSVRPSSHKDLNLLFTKDDFELQALPNGKDVGIKEFKRKFHGHDTRLFLIYNPRMQNYNSKSKLKKILKKIKTIDEWFEYRLNMDKWTSMQVVEKKICSLIGKTFLDCISYQIEIAEGHISYSVWINEDELTYLMDRMGKSFYMSNDESSSAIDLVWLYRQQYTVERIFNYLKLGDIVPFRPMRHFIDNSIRGHMFNVVLGLLMMMIMHREIVKQFPSVSLDEMVNILEDIQIVEIKFPDGEITKKLVTNSELAKEFVNKLWFFEDVSEFLKS